MGGRGVSPVGAGGSGRIRSGIRLRAENTPLSWSAVGGCWGALISSGGCGRRGGGAAPVSGRGWGAGGGAGPGAAGPGVGVRAAPGRGGGGRGRRGGAGGPDAR